ncbi:MAG: TIGR04282 family arsenosugar biosynthesis glycosyltransferase [Oscillatoria sp. PMC 1068.18]|nr:TIGR04282 family arsenosugar biosynthesis glycosyltransferase [Oscillatoria sp. PMC 1076.18]MEC4991693.1 TIGR04282 family arsenosugar biosynthesis glycosyltransferase [Oscillatoria sp. PMC 1068.18]
MGLDECLIIFSRYPEAGKTKTRMIPVLGAEGAAELQRQMTEYTREKAIALQSLRRVQIQVYFAGGSSELMQAWLGANLVYHPQSKGDLGSRMATAFQDAFATGMKRVVIIGIDCPDCNAIILASAFEMLSQQDLVLGSAADGGYYLIGLQRLIPELFIGVNWGTASVLSQTQAIAEKLNLAVGYLPLLNDVDRPEDLSIWERFRN